MPTPITNPVAIGFSNSVRPLCDILRKAALEIIAKQAEWFLVKDLFPNDDSVVADGSPEDGRRPITGADLHRLMGDDGILANIMEDAQEVSVELSPPTDLLLVTKISVN